MSRLHNLLQRANWLADIAGSPEADIRRDQGPGDPAEFAAIPTDQVVVAPESRIVYHTDPHSAAADRFRRMRIRLQALWSTGKLKKLLITSPLPGDGKSTVAMNLATALSERGKRTVLLVEADLHYGPLTAKLGLSQRPGLAECLESGSNPLAAVRHIMPLDWYFLPAGKASINPTELIQGQMLPLVIDRLASQFDWLVIDSPPVIPLSEVQSLKSHSDGSLLVVRAGRTSQDAVEEAVTLLGKQHVLGIILNGVEQTGLVYHKYGYGKYNGASDTKTRAGAGAS
jgi:protein-tyrosine kinase